jgi:zona occludens toxin
MFKLISGVPGSGKTLYTIWAVKQQAEAEGRVVYYHGIKDLTLDWFELADPEKWYELPSGSIIVIDEAQRIFPRRPASGVVPDKVKEFETHRHKGFDIYLITQTPNNIDAHLKGLVNNHIHIARKFGFHRAYVYTWQGLANVTQKSSFSSADCVNWTYPKEVFGYYKSAEIHTHKAHIPKRLLFLFGFAAILLIAAIWGAQRYYRNVIDEKGRSKLLTGATAAAAPGSGQGGQGLQPGQAGGGNAGPHYMTRNEYAMSLTPRVQGFPGTAPRYDEVNRPVVAPKPAACIFSAAQKRCTCYTQQATVLPDMPDAMCRQIVRYGYFDDTLPPPQPAMQASAGESQGRAPTRTSEGPRIGSVSPGAAVVPSSTSSPASADDSGRRRG